jgi:anti-anti-sigma regulatory factor
VIDVRVEAGGTLHIGGEATIYNAQELHTQLNALVTHEVEPVALDLSNMTALDTAGAQVLIAFKRSFPTLCVHSCPTEVRRFIEKAGLEAQLF